MDLRAIIRVARFSAHIPVRRKTGTPRLLRIVLDTLILTIPRAAYTYSEQVPGTPQSRDTSASRNRSQDIFWRRSSAALTKNEPRHSVHTQVTPQGHGFMDTRGKDTHRATHARAPVRSRTSAPPCPPCCRLPRWEHGRGVHACRVTRRSFFAATFALIQYVQHAQRIQLTQRTQLIQLTQLTQR